RLASGGGFHGFRLSPGSFGREALLRRVLGAGSRDSWAFPLKPEPQTLKPARSAMWIPGLGRYKPQQGNRVGDAAPDFTLLNQDGREVHLRDELGDKPIALVFYPKASSMVCTKQMCSLRNG